MTDLFPATAPRVIPAAPAQLTNMRLALATMMECQEAEEGSPRIGVFYGPSGYGKSYAAAHIAARMRAIYIEALPIWSQIAFLRAIATELGIQPMAKTGAGLLDQIISHLNDDPVPLLIDEMDHLVKHDKVEIIRAIHDKTGIPVMLIGEEGLPSQLRRWERFDNRILTATPAQPSTLGDGLLLRDHYCQRARVADDLVAEIVARTKGVTRRIVVNLQEAQKAAILDGADSIDLAGWGDRRIRDGSITPRRAVAA